VTPDEAFAELGIVPGVDADSARRAYLRLIKTRRPEADPAGFQRARQAYELVRGMTEIEAFAAESEPGVRYAAVPAEPEAAGAAERLARSESFIGFLRAWEAAPAVSAGEQHERLEIALEAVSALPQDPRAHWLLVNTLSGWRSHDRVVEALRAGHSAGFLEFLEALLVRFPTHVLRSEIETALASDRISLRLAGAVAVARLDAAAAAAVVVETCRGLRSAPDAALSLNELLSATLSLYEAGALGPAATAHNAVRDLVREQRLELSLVNSPLGGRWTLTEEVSALPAELPDVLRRAFVAGARAGDLNAAFSDACGEVRRDAKEMYSWVQRLRPKAPNIAGTLVDAMAHLQLGPAYTRRFRIAWMAAVIMMLLFGGLMAAVCGPPTMGRAPAAQATDGKARHDGGSAFSWPGGRGGGGAVSRPETGADARRQAVISGGDPGTSH
jgi:hypothetical protein